MHNFKRRGHLIRTRSLPAVDIQTSLMEKAHNVLSEVFGFSSFRLSQEAVC